MDWVILLVIAILSGSAMGLNSLASGSVGKTVSWGEIFTAIAVGAGAMVVVLGAMRLFVIQIAKRINIPLEDRYRWMKLEAWSSAPALISALGFIGINWNGPAIVIAVGVFMLVKAGVLWYSLPATIRDKAQRSVIWLGSLFFISGIAALIYQIVWQRVLSTTLGVNIESITLIVSLFMFGLGVGAMVGGYAAGKWPNAAAWMFFGCEVGIGVFGLVSMPLIHWVCNRAVNWNMGMMGLAVFGLLIGPTMLMGATLPVLVGHLNRQFKNMGRTVGMLYCINTLGSAAACWLTADLLFITLKQWGAVIVAACCNILVGWLVSAYIRRVGSN